MRIGLAKDDEAACIMGTSLFVTYHLLRILGQTVAALPDFVRAGLCGVLGWIGWHGLRKRRTTILRNLHHAFPDQTEAWRRKIARTCFVRVVEMGLLSLALPFLPVAELKRRFPVPAEDEAVIDEGKAAPPGLLVLSPHTFLMEALTTGPFQAQGLQGTSVLFRPLKSPAMDRFVQEARERSGIFLLSRKEGFVKAMQALRNGQIVTMLFDQNAGTAGVLLPFLGRTASATDLPDLLARKYQPNLYLSWIERTGFWRGTFRFQPFALETRESPIVGAHRWLETRLRESEEHAADWLWLHDRWKTQDAPTARLHLHAKKSYLPTAHPPRGTKFFVRLPNWLGDVVMALPLLRAVRRGRPDVEITLLGKAHLQPLLERFDVADRFLALPAREEAARFFRTHRQEYPDTALLLTNSWRGDLEMRRLGIPQRFGIDWPGRWRPFLTHVWPLPESLDLRTVHQMKVWQQFLQHFGLREEPDLTPFARPLPTGRRIGIIAGTENFPAKRWPIPHWITLLRQLVNETDAEIHLFGTRNDIAITSEIATAVGSKRVVDRAGQTNLGDFLKELAACRLVVCNDTGGMHLANALGVPVVALFGPTNPLRTGPVFAAPVTILQPEGCPPTGGASLEALAPEAVAEAVRIEA